MIVHYNDSTKVEQNFTSGEFYLGTVSLPIQRPALGKDWHEIDDRLPKIVQAIRDFVGVPIRITSTFRVVNVGAKSQHRFGRAIDFQFTQNNQANLRKVFENILAGGELFHTITAYGYDVRGIGMYNTFCHLDVRPDTGEYLHTIGDVVFALWFGDGYSLTDKNIHYASDTDLWLSDNATNTTTDEPSLSEPTQDTVIPTPPSTYDDIAQSDEVQQELEDDKPYVPDNNGNLKKSGIVPIILGVFLFIVSLIFMYFQL